MGIKRVTRRAAKTLRAFFAFGPQGLRKLSGVGRRMSMEIGHGSIELGERVTFGNDCGIAVIGWTPDAPARVTIGDRTSFQDRFHLNCTLSVEIGAHCAFSWDVDILDSDCHQVVQEGGVELPMTKPVKIGDRVWVGSRVQILKGVTLGDDCVVAAGSVVTRSFPPRSLVGGNPAKLIRTIDGWKP